MSDDAGRILVTGANGHLGRRLLQRLSTETPRRRLRAAVRSERAAETLRAQPTSAHPDEIEIVDYGDAEALSRAARGCSHAVHLVGILKETRSNRYERAHEGSCRALAEAADAAGLRRVVYVSVLGADRSSDNACLASKARAEAILLGAKTPALVLRVPMVLGPDDYASRALARQARARRVALVRGGASLEQPIAADDAVAALRAGLDAEGLDDVVLELAGPESLSHRALLERAARVLDAEPPSVVYVPLALARIAAFVAPLLAEDPPLTSAMLGVLEHDDAIDPAESCRRLGIALTPLDEALRRGLEASP